MRRLHTTVGAGVLLLAIAACAEQQPSVGYGGPPPAPPAPPGPVTVKPVEQRVAVPESAVDSSKLPGSYPKKVWTQDGGNVVVATGEEGGCSKVHAETAEQTAEQVKVVFVEETPEPPGICTMDLRYPPVTAKLDSPLGQRKIVLDKREVKVPRR